MASWSGRGVMLGPCGVRLLLTTCHVGKL